MNWITTNIRFPEDLYMELKMISAQKRESMSSLVRQAVKNSVLKDVKPSFSETIARLDRIAKIISKKTGKSWDSTKAIREMRYQQ